MIFPSSSCSRAHLCIVKQQVRKVLEQVCKEGDVNCFLISELCMGLPKDTISSTVI